MGWDWVKILKEEMLDLKSDEHLTRHAATDRLAWVSSQAPARAPLPADDWPDHPGTPPRGHALLGYDDEDLARAGGAAGAPTGFDAATGAGAGSGFNAVSGFNSEPLYGGADDRASGAHRRQAGGEVPGYADFDFAMPTNPPLEYPAPAPGGLSSPNPGASLPPAAASSVPVETPRVPRHASPGQDLGVDPLGAGGMSAAGMGAAVQPGLAEQPDLRHGRADGPGQFDAAEPGHVLTLIIDGVLAGVALPTGTEVTVGRERQCSLIVPEDKQTVSRRAVTLTRAGRRSVEARIENRNGAWVTRHLPEGTRQEFVERGNSVTLRTGDRLALDPPGTVVVGLGEPQ